MNHAVLGAVLVVAAAGGAATLARQQTPNLQGANAPANGVWLDSLDYTGAIAGRAPKPGRTLRDNPTTLGGAVYQHGLGVSSNSELWFDLGGGAATLLATVGIDDSRRTGHGSVSFEAWVDGKRVFDSGLMRAGDVARAVDVDLARARQLVLVVTDGGDTPRDDVADWAGAAIVRASGSTQAPRPIPPPAAPAAAIASSRGGPTRINGPRVVGTTPGRPFFFLIPATGEGPLTYAATALPDGLSLDSKTGIITGTVARAGASEVALHVSGPSGQASARLTIRAGEHELAQTPPIGWNSWNVWAEAVDAAKVRAAADAMVSSGLAAHGFRYINIDDTWEAGRDANGEIQTNEKFGDMKALADYVHAKGLGLGIYSSPGPKTCAGFTGSYHHEAQDAATYAKWGIDYLKYDWCSYSEVAGRTPTLDQMKQPYALMRGALDKTDRDIVFSLCQYGMGDVWEWGAEVGGNVWRTTGDITDTWQSLAGIGFNQNGHERFAAPGHWNDPDMLVVGRLGWGPHIHPTRLTPDEQITHITLWSLLAAPLLIGADMSALDQFTTDLLGNDEVLAIDQDAAGHAARRVARDGGLEVWARPLADGSVAVGLFNRSPYAATVTARWADLGLSGPRAVRDLWRQKDLGTFTEAFAAPVPSHGAVLVKIGR
ncbi:MAG TPA: NPCBM/NEW2 domain-containing protein [Vicinamibacterales bacterium]|nr:NPCBM/NEW2 domain-containing protein [Vicinamibacterales bacterium]